MDSNPRDKSLSQRVAEALSSVRDGTPGAIAELVSLIYPELAGIAHKQLGMEHPGHTLSTTALVHEAYLRLISQTDVQWVDRSHFLAAAAQAMRRILVDHARRHQALRRGAGRRRTVSLESLSQADMAGIGVDERADTLVVLDEALERLSAINERQAKVVECRFFGGLTEAETAEVLGITSRTVTRDWYKARGWLYRELADGA